MTATILVTGGAGYIGSHDVKYLRRCGYRVLVLDDLRRGFADVVPDGLLVRGSTGNRELLDRIFGEYDIDAVMHFAACHWPSKLTP